MATLFGEKRIVHRLIDFDMSWDPNRGMISAKVLRASHGLVPGGGRRSSLVA